MKYVIPLACVVVFFLCDLPVGYSISSPWWTHCTYMFQHAGVIHLAVNSIAYIGMLRSLEGLKLSASASASASAGRGVESIDNKADRKNKICEGLRNLPYSLAFVFSVWILSVVATYGTAHDVPTVGASGMVYVMIGFYIGVTLLKESIRIVDRRRYGIFLLGVVLCLGISALKGNSNFLLHFQALLLGFMAACVFVLVEHAKLRRKSKRI